jgi:hypothetical protein
MGVRFAVDRLAGLIYKDPMELGDISDIWDVFYPSERTPRDGGAIFSWARRRRLKLEAACRFGQLGDRLVQNGAAEPMVTMARAAAADETRHARICAELMRHFGAEAIDEEPRLSEPSGPDAGDARSGLLLDVVALSCVAESIGAALITALVPRAQDELVRGVLHAILADEVSHNRLGWAYLAHPDHRTHHAIVAEHLPRMLEQAVEADLFADADDGDGALEGLERCAIVADTIERVVMPGMSRLGVDVRRGDAWLSSWKSDVLPQLPAGAGGVRMASV